MSQQNILLYFSLIRGINYHKVWNKKENFEDNDCNWTLTACRGMIEKR